MPEDQARGLQMQHCLRGAERHLSPEAALPASLTLPQDLEQGLHIYSTQADQDYTHSQQSCNLSTLPTMGLTAELSCVTARSTENDAWISHVPKREHDRS